MEDEQDFIPISALQHVLYCPRQCALIHVEQQWAESQHTAEGRILHQRVDEQQMQRRRDRRTVTGMPLSHHGLRIVGIADMIEFLGPADEQDIVPVEYKRGRPKAHRADEVQLCAQALCLEEMLGRSIRAGALFYGQPRRRTEVVFDTVLRHLTEQTIAQARALFESGLTPSASYEPRRCDAWVETLRSSRVRLMRAHVAPRAGAWVETSAGLPRCIGQPCRAPCGRVG